MLFCSYPLFSVLHNYRYLLGVLIAIHVSKDSVLHSHTCVSTYDSMKLQSPLTLMHNILHFTLGTNTHMYDESHGISGLVNFLRTFLTGDNLTKSCSDGYSFLYPFACLLKLVFISTEILSVFCINSNSLTCEERRITRIRKQTSRNKKTEKTQLRSFRHTWGKKKKKTSFEVTPSTP